MHAAPKPTLMHRLIQGLQLALFAATAVLFIGGCSPSLVRAELTDAAAVTANSPDATGRFTADGYTVKTGDPMWQVDMTSRGVASFASSPSGAAGVAGGNVFVTNAQDAAFDELLIEYFEPQFDPVVGGLVTPPKTVTLRGFRGSGDALLRQAVALRDIHVRAVMQLSDDAARAYIEQLRVVDNVLAAAVEAAVQAAGKLIAPIP